MNKNFSPFVSLLFLMLSVSIFSQEKKIWSRISASGLSTFKIQERELPKEYQVFSLDLESTKNELNFVDNKRNINGELFQLQFPDENGKMNSYEVSQVHVMHPDLEKKYPNNKTFVGHALDDNSKKVRFSINEKGLYGMLTNSSGEKIYIDPISKDKSKYILYNRKALQFEDSGFTCHTEDFQELEKYSSAKVSIDDKKLRTYRLALACTGEYANYHLEKAGLQDGTENEKKALILSEMVIAINRVNDIYENELSISLQLIANNDELIYLDPDNDPYTDNDGSAMLTENQLTCDNVIGTDNYDIGHVFSTGGGGIAYKGSTCSSSKAGGVTGSSNPIGEYFYFDYVAHEMGHQFGANHTFNGDALNCGGGTRNSETAVEPGSGSTIMAYAGICAPQNVQAHSDLYFHIVTIDEIWKHITEGVGNSCGVKTSLTSNLNVPLVNAGGDYTIPKSTPYVLRGQGSDADGDPITFCWEQIDNEITDIPPSSNATGGALYRSLNPTVSPNRYMPNLATIVKGDISSTWEVTPVVAREMNFNLTIRDNNSEGGQLAIDEMKVTVTDLAGPFKVTSQNIESVVWTKGSTETITWDVAGTDANGVNVSNVNIKLSMDGGKTFDSTLIANTPNDGSQNITVPNLGASRCFVMVEAVDNLFLSVNTSAFSIGEFNEVCEVFSAEDTPVSIPDNDNEGATSSINISKDIIIEDIEVTVLIKHPYVEDLELELISPKGTVIGLIDGACSNGQDMNATFSESGDLVKCNLSVPAISGLIKPIGDFYDLIGDSAIGTWKLKAMDSGQEDQGSISDWSIKICSSKEVVGVSSYPLNNFNVYPNPSEEYFNIEFNSMLSSDIDIHLFDLLGRKVLSKNYKFKDSFFSERIDLNQISSGLYILQVKQGNMISTKKIHKS